MAAGEFNDLGHLGFRHLEGEDAADPDAVTVDMQHHLDRILAALAENLLQNVNDKLHRRVVVVEQEHLVEIGLLGLGARLGDDAGSRTVIVLPILAVPAI